MLISLPRSLNAEIISDCESLKTFQHVGFELPLNLLVWSQPVNALGSNFVVHFCPGTTTHAEPINSDLQRGLDRRLRHTQHRTQNRTC